MQIRQRVFKHTDMEGTGECCVYSGNMASLSEACSSGNVEAVRVLLKQGDLREGADDGDSLLSLAASAGYYELCQVLL